MSEFFVIDLSWMNELATATPWGSFWIVFTHGGWAIILWALLWGLWHYWLFYIQNAYTDSIPYVMLAIDVPKNNEQGPLAVENVFSQIAGAHGTETLWEKYWKGETQLSFSFEIVSIDGYVQFVVRTPVKFRDLVEASIYAQYPDAEITEIEDYVPNVPQRWPNPDYRFFGIEYKLHKPDAYPIRTYLAFEDKLVGEFKDPMAALMEIMSKISPGEQVWIQFIVTPIDDTWQKEGEKLVDKLISRQREPKDSIFQKIISLPAFAFSLLLSLLDAIVFPPTEGREQRKKDEPPTMMLHLSPGEKDVIAAVQRKMSKLGFRVKNRIMYIARNEVYHAQRGAHAVVGAMKQYNTVDCNRFSVQKKIWTKVYYVFTKYRLAFRQRRIMHAYRVRSDSRGAGAGFILNIEELASVWHFPVMTVKAPLVKRTEAKRAEPPFTLPTEVPRIFRPKEEREEVEMAEPPAPEIQTEVEKGEPPPNLPVV